MSHQDSTNAAQITASGTKYTVFPLQPLTPAGECACSEGPACPRPGKHPSIRWGDLEAGQQVFGPGGHGLATGARSGVFVVDTDTPEADARFRAACEDEGWGLDTYTVRTPKGGRHYYYVWPGFPVRSSVGELLLQPGDVDARGKPNSKIDVRGDGGFAVTAGSPHKSGGKYETEINAAPCEAPDFLLDWSGLRGREIVASALAPIPVDVNTDEGRKRGELGIEACATMEESTQGSNGSLALFNLSLRLIRDLELPLTVAQGLVEQHYNPRCDPPWSAREIEHKLTDARDKSDRLPGLVPDDLLDRVIEDQEAARKATRTEHVSTRRQRDPSHRYSYKIGALAKNDSARKATLNEVIHHFGSESDAADWTGVWQFNSFLERVECVNPPMRLDAETNGLSNGDTVDLRSYLEHVGFLATNDMVFDAVTAAARANAYHPVREYLGGLEPCEGAIDELATHGLGLTDDLDRAYVRKFLIAAVRRILTPGCKVDSALTLHGPKGMGKSSFVFDLFGHAWSTDSIGSIDDEKGVGERIAGKWAVELGELRALKKADMRETVLQFIPRQSDRYRGAYARGNAIDRPRQCVFIATTNDKEIFQDPNGAEHRRFWIISPPRIDREWVLANRDRVWGEAHALALTNEPHWLDAEQEAEHFRRMRAWEIVDDREHAIRQYLVGCSEVTSQDIWRSLGNLGAVPKGEQMQIAKVLRQLGCMRNADTSKRTWLVPEALSREPLAPQEQARRAAIATAEGRLFN
ncbi:MAG: bifunctional DNA primase/polymerase [Labilithrix sp.]|nr:bifunctional DNA primase/polymerase [Labilithrix sp.]